MALVSIREKLEALNNADLSQLMSRIKAAKDELSKKIEAEGDDPNREVSDAEIKKAAATAGVTIEEFMDALEFAKRMGLI